MLLERGTLLNNRYRIVEVLGQGGMGSVYRAVDEHLEIEVAVKDNLFTTDEYARQFHREASILARLRHPSLPRVTDYFAIEGLGQYLVMDYIEGEDLRERMDRIERIPEQDVIVIGAAICDALSYLSSRNPPVIHRDIKPGNVKITPNGEIFLVDFGLAKTLQGSQVTTTGARAMTPGYSPPEQYGTARTDTRTDIFSLGATLYAALTGLIPEESLARAMGQIKLTPIRSRNPRVSKKLTAAVEKALELHPGDRYQSPEEFKQALIALDPSVHQHAGYQITPPPFSVNSSAAVDNGIPGKGKLPESKSGGNYQGDSDKQINLPEFGKNDLRRRRKVGCLVPAVVILAAALLTAWVLIQYPALYSRLYYSIRTIVVPAAQVSPSPNPAISFQTTIPTASAVQSQASPIAVILPPKALPETDPVPTQTRSQVLPTLTPTFLPTPVGGGAGQLAYASDITGVPQVFLIGSDGTNRRQITEISEGACQPDFSPDGAKIVFISPCGSNFDFYPGASLYIINADGTGLLPLPTMQGGDFDPAWSPDGKNIAFTSLRGNNRPQIFNLNLDTNTVTPLSQKYMFDSQPTWTPDGKQLLFVSERNGRQDIWQMDADGRNQVLFSHTPTYLDSLPSVTPDGKEVLITQYLSQEGVPRVVSAALEIRNLRGVCHR